MKYLCPLIFLLNCWDPLEAWNQDDGAEIGSEQHTENKDDLYQMSLPTEFPDAIMPLETEGKKKNLFK